MASFLVLLSLPLLASADPGQTAVIGEDDKLTLRIPGATLTLEGSNDCSSNSDGSQYIEQGFVSEAITAAVNAKLDGYPTSQDVSDMDFVNSTDVEEAKNSMTEEIENFKNDIMEELKSTKADMSTELRSVLASGNTFVSSVAFTHCTPKGSKFQCPSGDPNITATIFGRGLMSNFPGLYSCVITIDGKDFTSNATVTNYPNDKQALTCTLPGAYHPEDTFFDASLKVMESGIFTIDSNDWNPLIQYYNTAPTIEDLVDTAIIAGSASRLGSDGKSIQVQLTYDDFYDDWHTLDASFKSLTTDILPDSSTSFRLNKRARILKLVLDKNTLDNFKSSADNIDYKEVLFNMTLTDSHDVSFTKTLGLNLTIGVAAWSDDGAPTQLTDLARLAIFQRLGKPAGTKFTKCYDALRDGWDYTTFHKNCDGKGPILLIARPAGKAQYFGGFQHIQATSTCSYYRGGVIGNVNNGQPASDRGWMFRIDDETPDQVEFAYQKSDYAYYRCNRYFPTWGNGFDFYCSNTYCSCNIGRGYRTVEKDIPEREFCMGVYSVRVYSYNLQAAWKAYEVYTVEE